MTPPNASPPPKRPSRRTKRSQTALSRHVLPAYRPLVLILGPTHKFEQVAAIGAFAHARGFAPVVPPAAKKEWIYGDPNASDDVTPSIARALGRDGAKLWILGPLDDALTFALLAYGDGFTIGKYRVPILRELNPEKPVLNKDIVLGTWAAWRETIDRSEHRALLDYFTDDFGL